jgi:hypothetical protein
MRRMTASVCSRRAAILAAALLPLWMLAIPHDALALTTQEVEQIVEEFFPQELIDESQADFKKGGPAPFRARAFALADLDGTGTANYIVAAYTNGFRARIRVLKLQGSTPTLIAEPNLRLLGGIFPAVELVDIENDGRPEVVIHFSSATASLFDWVFKWTGTELRLIGPSSVDEHGDTFTSLGDSNFDDVDGDEILEITQRSAETQTITVYRFDGQKFALTKTLNFFRTFYRHAGTPVLQTAEFEVQNPGGRFVLTIVNGDRNGANRVSSGTIKLNGVVVLTPNDLNQQVRTVVRQVTVLASNVLEAELAGKPTGQVLITVEPPPQ